MGVGPASSLRTRLPPTSAARVTRANGVEDTRERRARRILVHSAVPTAVAAGIAGLVGFTLRGVAIVTGLDLPSFGVGREGKRPR